MSTKRPVPKTRSSNFELLRVISILLIITHHYAVHGGFEFAANVFSANKALVQILSIGGTLDNNCFVLISAYFLITSTGVTLHRVLKFWLQVVFYTAGIGFLFVVAGWSDFSWTLVYRVLTPITHSALWFASTYFVMYILSPYINKFIKALDKTAHLTLLCLLMVIWCVVPTFTDMKMQSNNLIWFFTLYLVAAYIRLYRNRLSQTCKGAFCTAFAALALIVASILMLDVAGTRLIVLGENATYFTGMQTIPMVVLSISLFLGFKNLKIKPNKLINTFASATFGVYLLHDSDFIKGILWRDILKNWSYAESPWLWLHALGSVAAVFLVCTVFELLRKALIEPLTMKIVDACEPALVRRAANIKQRFLVWHDTF